jgi:acetyl-CoA C-acetyltransferase
MRDVFVSGIGSTIFGEHFEKNAVDLACLAIEKALCDSDKKIGDIDAIYVGNMLAGLLDGQNHLGAHIAQQLGVNVPIYRAEAACASGGIAMNMGWQSVGGGHCENVLVVGTESMTKAGTQKVNDALKNAASDAERSVGIGFAHLYGLMARAYLEKYKLEENVLWWGPALMHKQACSNPKAQYKKAFSVEQVGASRMICDPLRLLECSPHTDGAAAVVLSSDKNKVRIVDSCIVTDSPGLAERESLESVFAAQTAWKKVKIKNGIKSADLDVVELHDCFSIGGVMALEDLELAKRGTGGDMYKALYEGTFTSGLVVNPSGGLKACGHPVGATGVKQIVALVEFFRENPKAKKGLSHNIGGTGGTAVIHYVEQI